MAMYIVMDMNIYITKDNEKFLKNLKPDQSMSGVINRLLTNYRKNKAYDIFPLGPNERHKPELVIDEVDPILVPPVAKNISRYSKGVCKIHGTPLTDLGKCLQKGCKYA